MEQPETCAICLGPVDVAGGQAIFTAECKHIFHFNCISASVAHGNLVCPLCKAQWHQLPFFGAPPSQHWAPPPPTPPAPRHPRFSFGDLSRNMPFYPSPEPRVFNDDEQVDPPASRPAAGHADGTPHGRVELTACPEFAAVARAAPANLAVMVHLKAPSADAVQETTAVRAPLDLVTVLDVSGSMAGSKLTLLKQAMKFVIENLSPVDRLSIVSFSSGAKRILRLSRMSDSGMQTAIHAVDSLTAGGGTNIAEGLRKAAKVTDDRRHRNAVTSIILLSDGQDTYTVFDPTGERSVYDALITPSILHGDGGRRVPIHTFGFGTDHDAAAMHAIAESTGGTFSFIENEAVIQDAFALCLGGLLSVVAQDVRLHLRCVRPGAARLTAIKSGSYESRMDGDGAEGWIDVGDLYADEERRFLAFLAVPPADEQTTRLMNVTCRYKDAGTEQAVEVSCEEVAVARSDAGDGPVAASPEVERERARVEATEDMMAARAAAERGAHEEAVQILEKSKKSVASSSAAHSGDSTYVALEGELKELQSKVSSKKEYESSGRAYMLTTLSSHVQQRATSISMADDDSEEETRDLDSFAALPPPPRAPGMAYLTPRMRMMVKKSRTSQPPPRP